MPRTGWRWVAAAAALLAPSEREVVLGDLAEMNCGVWHGLGDVLGLAARRQLALWKNWRPWAASFGLALPASLFLMGCSVAVSTAIAGIVGRPAQAGLLGLSVSTFFFVMCWAWMAGFVVATVSRGTVWASLLACCAPCLHCLSLWPGHGFSALRLLIFVLPGLWGVLRGRRHSQLALSWSVFLTVIAMLAPLMWSKGGWMYGCWLFWPGCYLTATAWREKA